MLFFFFFKQKTAYEMRISDWSSDVCSSDLLGTSAHSELARMAGAELAPSGCIVVDEHQQTTISGMFAAGDMVEGLDQIAVAAGQAGRAAPPTHTRLSGCSGKSGSRHQQ